MTMADIRALTGSRIVPDTDTVLRLLGVGDKSARYEQYQRQVRMLIRPRAILAFEECSLYVVMTLGAAISDYVTRLFARHEEDEALWINAIADSCLFAFEEQIRKTIGDLCREKGRGVAGRREVGNGLEPGAVQRILEMTEARRRIGVSMTAAGMVLPSKTMCFLFDLTAHTDADAGAEINPCRQCGNDTCTLRRSAAAGRVYTCPPGESVLTFLRRNGVSLGAACGGNGSCGKCRVRLYNGHLDVTYDDLATLSAEELDRGWRLACKAVPQEPVTVCVSQGEETSFRAVGTLTEPLKKAAAGHLFGAAVDVGTTTIAVSLVDLTARKVVDTVTAVNSQRVYGADVISRIQAAAAGHAAALRRLVCRDIYGALQRLWQRYEGTFADCGEIVVASNTTMTHLLLGLDCSGLGRWPFTPVSLGGDVLPWRRIFPDYAGPAACRIRIVSGISTYVGADVVAGLYACRLDSDGKNAVFLDLGTNGEMAVAKEGMLYVASAAAGPALEGGQLSCGTGSVPGAVAAVDIIDGKAAVRTIDCAPAAGLCGTGVIEALAALLQAGFVDRSGKLAAPYFSGGFPIARKQDGTVLTLTQQDIRQVQLAKGAVRAGLEALLQHCGLTYGDVGTLYLAGGFGYFLKAEKAAAVGLLPRELAARTVNVGNTSLAGAVALLTERDGEERLRKIIASAREVALAGDAAFRQLYINYMDF